MLIYRLCYVPDNEGIRVEIEPNVSENGKDYSRRTKIKFF